MERNIKSKEVNIVNTIVEPLERASVNPEAELLDIENTNNVNQSFIISLVLLSTLNLIDMICTYVGLKLNLIGESNPLMDYLYNQNEMYFLLVKVVLSIVIFLLAYKIKKDNIKFNRVIENIFKLVTVAYVFIFFIHSYWLSLLF